MTPVNARTYLKQIAAMTPGRDYWQGGKVHEGHFDFIADIRRIDDAVAVIGGVRGSCIAAGNAVCENYHLYRNESGLTRAAVFAAVQSLVVKFLNQEATCPISTASL